MRTMGAAARQNILASSWDVALEMTYSAYRFCKDAGSAAKPLGAAAVLARPPLSAA
jgi:hypothetical protein